MDGFQFANCSQPVPDATDIPISFSIRAPPSTDVWDKPPATHSFNAPILHRTLPLKSFKRARVSVAAEWKTLYDQGGLLLAIHQNDNDDKLQARKWIKTGIEYTGGKPHVSVVAKDRWADWSLASLPFDEKNCNTATIEIVRERESESESDTLWVYLIVGEARVPLREVTWAFEGEDSESSQCWIGVYAAKPTPDETNGLLVQFRGLVVDTV